MDLWKINVPYHLVHHMYEKNSMIIIDIVPYSQQNAVI